MIKLIHRHNKIITYVFLFIAVCFMFSGVGLDILHSGDSADRYAIKVNSAKIPFQEVERTRETLTSRYRQMLGDNFENFAASLNLNISQQAVDSLVDSTLLDQEAARWGFAGNDEIVSRFIVTKLFAGRPVSREALGNTLRGLGMNYRQLSERIKTETSRQAFVDLMRDVSFVSKRDVEARYTTQETAFTLLTATVNSDSLTSEVPQPTEETLKKLYNATATTYELPAQVSYEFLTFNSKDFEKDVQVLPQDLEFYYTENPSKFKTAEQARIRSITLLYPKESDPKAMAAVKEKAKKVHEEAMSGKPFNDLVQMYSDDLPSKLAGGDKGWVQRGQGEKNFDKAVFAAAPGAVTELIETGFGFQIVRVEEKKEPTQRPFADVKASIEADIRKREAPSYAAAKAQELIALTKKNDQGLSAAAAALKLPAPTEATLRQQGQDPDPLLQGLTKRALQIPPSERLIATMFDVGETTVALRIKEFKEPFIQPFEAVKDKVLQGYKNDQASVLAEKRARELLESIAKDPTSLVSVATAKKYKVAGPFDITRAKPSNPTFSELPADLARDAVASNSSPRILSRAYKGNAGYTVGVVSKVTPPDLSSAASIKALDEYRETASASSEQQSMQSVISLLKAKSDIDVDPSLFAAGS